MSLQLSSWGNSPAAVEFFKKRLSVNGMRPHAGLHANAVLPHEAWEELDMVVLDVIRNELRVAADFIAAGLTHTVSDLGVTVSIWQRMTDMDGAQVDMAAETAGNEDQQGFEEDGVPVPLHHKDFRLNIRTLLASARSGNGLDTIQVTTATRKVSESWEAMAVNGTNGVTSGGYTIYGLTNHPNITTDTADNFAGDGAGSGDFTTVGNAYNVILGMINALDTAGFTSGNIGFYVARAQFSELHKRHSDGSRQSQLMSIMENLGIGAGGRVAYIRPSDDLASGVVVGVILMSDVVDLAIVNLEGGQIIPVQWSSMGEIGGTPILSHFKVIGAMAPRIKARRNSAGTLKAGIVKATGA